jgi:hypothetical protein
MKWGEIDPIEYNIDVNWEQDYLDFLQSTKK